MRQRFSCFLIPALCLLALSLPAGAETARELFDQGSTASGNSDWPRCAELFGKAGEAFTSDSQAARAYFAAAACSAAAGQKETAFGYLDKAAAKGHRDVERATHHPRVKVLHDDPRWKAFLAGVEARAAEHEKGSSPELKRIYNDDQWDRRGFLDEKVDWSVIPLRDAERRKRVREILDAGGARTAADYHHAAMVFQHGVTLDDYDLAHKLALKAVELDPERPGAKYRTVNGKTVLWKVDPFVTDEERAKWDCPPLAVAKKQEEEMNRRQ